MLVNDFDDVNDRMDRIIEDINESRYQYDEEELSIDSVNEVPIDDESDCEVDQPIEGAIRSAMINSGSGVDRLEPTRGGENKHEVKKKLQFLM